MSLPGRTIDRQKRSWCVTLGRSAGLGVLLLVLMLVEGAGAQELPPDVARSIEHAAEEGQRYRRDFPPSALEFELNGNRWLQAATVTAIVERPEFTDAIMRRAVAADPQAAGPLVRHVNVSFPGYAPVIAAATGGTVEAPAPGVDSPAAWYGADTSLPPLADRPPGWPILPKEGGADGYDDPLEGMNRVFFYFNGALDFLIFEPLARVYRFVMPDKAKPHVRNAFDNLSLPVVFANDLLQLEFAQAGETLARLLINSTVGVVGLFDPAATLGLEPHDTGFGETLYLYGVGDGFYLVLPLLGPAAVRDAVGAGVDGLLDPRSYLLTTETQLALYLAGGIVIRERELDSVDFLTENAEDPYVAVRAWIYQQRARDFDTNCLKRKALSCPDR
ncbi:MAG: VacJ family lipoprotein [Alphaproteobacteria bacterium]